MPDGSLASFDEPVVAVFDFVAIDDEGTGDIDFARDGHSDGLGVGLRGGTEPLGRFGRFEHALSAAGFMPFVEGRVGGDGQ
jgi:hypothetical protein